MSKTLSNGTTTLALPDSLLWVDEHQWSPVAQKSDYLLTGALLVQESAKQAGRPITLEGKDSGWMARADLATLQAFAAAMPAALTLAMTGYSAMTVMFRHDGNGAIDAERVLPRADPDNAEFFTVTIKLMEI